MNFESYELIQPFLTYEAFTPKQEEVEEFALPEQRSLTNLIDSIKQDSQEEPTIQDTTNPIFNNSTKKPIQKPSIFVNYTQVTNPKSTKSKSNDKPKYVGKSLSRTQVEQLMDQQGIGGEKKTTLLKIAFLESGFKTSAKAKGSSATGLFQMIDSTRRKVSSVSKQEFINNPEEQIRVASKLYDNCARQLRSWGLPIKGENIALMWLNPSWARTYLTTGTNAGQDSNGTSPSKYLNRFRNVHLR